MASEKSNESKQKPRRKFGQAKEPLQLNLSVAVRFGEEEDERHPPLKDLFQPPFDGGDLCPFRNQYFLLQILLSFV